MRLILSILFLFSNELYAKFVYEGVLSDVNGTAVSSTPVGLRFQILNPTADCALYEETMSVTTSPSGYFTALVGSGTSTAGFAYTALAASMRNTGSSVTGKTYPSSTASPTCPYNPTVGDVRQLAIFVTVPGVSEDGLGAMVINQSPVATVAEDALMLGGTAASSYVALLPASNKLPALDASNLFNIPGTSAVALSATSLSSALSVGATSAQNIALGGGLSNLASTATASQNIAIGPNSLSSFGSGSANIALGASAMNTASGGVQFNTAIGVSAGQAATNSQGNTLLGFSSAPIMTSATNNTVIGYKTGPNMAGASNNVMIGAMAGSNNPNQTNNVVIGVLSGINLASGAATNTLIGYNAGANLSSGNSNVLIGNTAGSGLSSGAYNVLIGNNVGSSLNSGSGNILIGGSIPLSVPANASNYLNIANAIFGVNLQGPPLIGIGNLAPAATLDVATSGTTPALSVASSGTSPTMVVANSSSPNAALRIGSGGAGIVKIMTFTNANWSTCAAFTTAAPGVTFQCKSSSISGGVSGLTAFVQCDTLDGNAFASGILSGSILTINGILSGGTPVSTTTSFNCIAIYTNN